MVNILLQLFFSLFFFMPAFAANPSAVIAKGSMKMDLGKNFTDGKRILGDGKTWRGFIGGSVFGYLTGILFFAIAYAAIFPVNYPFQFLGVSLSIAALSIGAMLGDAAGSFVKRRIGMKSGQNGFLLDQYPFVLVALLLLYLFSPSFFFLVYWNIPALLILLVVTPPLHRAINIVGYKMRRKSVPW